MTTRQGQMVWFVAIYGLSVATVALLALLTRMLLRGIWEH
jgi:hypothetical protein